jgi:hypothetical protein
MSVPTANVATVNTSGSPTSFSDTLGDVSDLKVDFAGSNGDATLAAQETPPDAAVSPDAVVDSSAASATATAPTQPAAPVDFGAQLAQMQQAQQLWQAQQQTQFAQLVQSLPQMFAQAMGQAIPQPPPPPPADPYAGLDQNDPDYHFHRLGIQNDLLKKQIQELADWRAKSEQAAADAQRQQAEQAQQAQFAEYAHKEVQKIAWQAFKDVEKTPQAERLFQLACDRVEAAWRSSGYTPQGAGRGFAEAQELVKTFLPAARAAQAAQTVTQTQQPLGGSRAPTLASNAQLAADPFARMRQTLSGDAAELAAIFNQTN